MNQKDKSKIKRISQNIHIKVLFLLVTNVTTNLVCRKRFSEGSSEEQILYELLYSHTCYKYACIILAKLIHIAGQRIFIDIPYKASSCSGKSSDSILLTAGISESSFQLVSTWDIHVLPMVTPLRSKNFISCTSAFFLAFNQISHIFIFCFTKKQVCLCHTWKLIHVKRIGRHFAFIITSPVSYKNQRGQICLVHNKHWQEWVLVTWFNYLITHFFFFFFLRSPAISLGFTTFWVRFLRKWPFFNPTIKVVTFRLHGWCVLGVFLLPAFTRLGHERQDLLSPCEEMHVCTD